LKAATVHQLKKELQLKSHEELVEISLRLSKFKKENKDLLTYLLFEVDDEAAYILSVKEEVEQKFADINATAFYYIKKSVRKILSDVKRHIRYSKKKETEVELLLHFCAHLLKMKPNYRRNTVLINLYERQLSAINKAILTLDEDLQYDFGRDLESLTFDK
jgi:hypothetical protein